MISIKSILIRLSTLENHSLYRNSCKIIGFINLADDVNWPPQRVSKYQLRNSLQRPIYLSNTFDKTKLFCIILHQSSTVRRAETAYGVNEAFSTSNSRLAHWRFFAVSCCLNILSGPYVYRSLHLGDKFSQQKNAELCLYQNSSALETNAIQLLFKVLLFHKTTTIIVKKVIYPPIFFFQYLLGRKSVSSKVKFQQQTSFSSLLARLDAISA